MGVKTFKNFAYYFTLFAKSSYVGLYYIADWLV